MRTGRKGYYKRTQAQDRSTSLNITVHDSDNAIGAGPDTHTKVFAASSKALNTTEAIDALELPFFQLGRHPGLIQPNRPALDAPAASGCHAPVLQLTNAASQVPIQDGPDNSDNGDTEVETLGVNPMQMIHFAIPSHAKEQPKAKASAKQVTPTTKAAAKASSAKDTNKGKKRKPGDEDQQTPKILRLTGPPSNVDPSSGKQIVAQSFSDVDAELLANYNESFKSLKKRVLAGLQDTDTSINDSLKTCIKDIGTLLKTFKGKTKSLKRRQDHGGKTSESESIEDMISELTNAQSIGAKLLSSQGDAEIVNELNTIVKTEWNVSAAMFKRGFKCFR